jgi:NAD(P)H-flavin reductase
LSHHFRSGRFSITVKRAGLVSSLLFDSATPGDAVAFRGVGGSFTPVTNSTRPALLVAGGIGERRSAGIPQGRP